MVGQKDRFLSAIALMSIEWRGIRAGTETIEILMNAEKEDKKKPLTDIQKLAVMNSIIERLGQAEYQMDVVSHLSMKIGKAYKTYDGE